MFLSQLEELLGGGFDAANLGFQDDAHSAVFDDNIPATKCRIGHFVEAQVLEALGIDYVDESEVLTPADEEHHIDKNAFTIPFVCGARDLGEALRRLGEGAAMIRTKGEAGTGNVVEAVRHIRAVTGAIRRLQNMRPEELMAEAKGLGAPYGLVVEVAPSVMYKFPLNRGLFRCPTSYRVHLRPSWKS